MSRDVRIRNIDPATVRPEDIFGQKAFIGISTIPPPSMPGLRRLVEWAHTRFRGLQLVLGDHLNRHNLMCEGSISLDEAGERAFEAGAPLRASIAAMLSVVAPRCHLLSSLEVFQSTAFLPVLKQIEGHFETDTAFRNLILLDVEAYEARRIRRGEEVIATHRRHSIDYMLEELAMFALLVDGGALINLYAGSHSGVVRALANHEVQAPVPALARQVCVQLSVSNTSD